MVEAVIALCQVEARGSPHLADPSLAIEDKAFCNRSAVGRLPQAASHSFSAQTLRLDECSANGSARTTKQTLIGTGLPVTAATLTRFSFWGRQGLGKEQKCGSGLAIIASPSSRCCHVWYGTSSHGLYGLSRPHIIVQRVRVVCRAIDVAVTVGS
jgi:hypothetical protein